MAVFLQLSKLTGILVQMTRRKMDGRMEAELLRITCSPAPDGRVRWTLRLLEKQIRLEFDEPISRESIRIALKKMNFDLI